MTDTGPILVATDLGDNGAHAVDLAVACANGMQWPIQLLHVMDLAQDAVPAMVPPSIQPALEAMQVLVRRRTDEAARRLEAERARVRAATQLSCEARLDEGHPWETICARAAELRSPLVVVSTHSRRTEARRGTITERLLGSTADRVVRHAPCPVLVAPVAGEPRRTLAGARWLVGIDFHDPSVEALRVARLFAERTRGHLETIHIVRARADDPGVEPFRESLHGHAREHALRRLAELGAKEVTVEVPALRIVERVSLGDPAEALVAAAHEHPETVLVVGTHGRGGLARLALGSTTERLLRRIDVPVLCVRRLDATRT